MRITCPNCRHELNASDAAMVSDLRCPVCRQKVVSTGPAEVSSPAGEAPPRVVREEIASSTGPGRRFGIPGWTWLILGSALLGLFAVPVAWYASRSWRVGRHQGVAEQVLKESEAWLKALRPGPSEALEQRLKALAENSFVDDVTKLDARRSLARIAVRKAAHAAAALHEEAFSVLEEEELGKTRETLEAYLQQPGAGLTESNDARRLLNEIELVTSPEQQKKRLAKLSDEELGRVRDGGSWPDYVLPEHPKLRSLFVRAARPLIQLECEKRWPAEKVFHKGQAVKNRGSGVTWRGTVQSVDKGVCVVLIEKVVGEELPFREGELHTFDETQLQAEDRALPP